MGSSHSLVKATLLAEPAGRAASRLPGVGSCLRPCPRGRLLRWGGRGGEKHKSVGKTGLCLMGKRPKALGGGRQRDRRFPGGRANRAAARHRGRRRGAAPVGEGQQQDRAITRLPSSVSRRAWLSPGSEFPGAGETQGEAAEGRG